MLLENVLQMVIMIWELMQYIMILLRMKHFFVQSKWRKEGTGGISQDEMNTFVEGIKRVINCEFEGCNNKLYAKKIGILKML